MQVGHFRIEQNPIDLRVVCVPRANLNRPQGQAITKGSISNTSNAIWDRDTCQATTIKEAVITNAFNAVRNRDASQAGAITEGCFHNTADAIRDDVTGTRLGCSIGMQQTYFLIEQNPIDLRVIHISRANLNRPQGHATTKCCIPNAGNTIWDRDTCQAAAIKEAVIANAFNAIWNRDARQAGAISEGALSDTGNATRNCYVY